LIYPEEVFEGVEFIEKTCQSLVSGIILFIFLVEFLLQILHEGHLGGEF